LFMGAAGGAAFGHLCHALFPGLEMAIPTFAIAGMAAAIGGSTGAVLTGIVMLTEMTKDHSIMLPLVITCGVAYAVRKAIMTESIYTMKLRSRGHAVPEGLHASTLNSARIRDMMTRDFAVVRQGDELPAGATIVVHTENSVIVKVTRHQGTGSGVIVPGSERHVLRYVLVNEHEEFLAALSALLEAEAELVLVSRNPGARLGEDVVGMVTPAALSRLLKTDEDLS